MEGIIMETSHAVSERKHKERNDMEKNRNHDAEISFFAAECMEFAEHGELQEGLSLSEAVKAYERIRKKGAACGPGIGFVLQDPKIPKYSGIRWPLYQGRGIAVDEIQLIPAYRDHPLVKETIQEMESCLPGLTESRKHNRKRNAQETGAR